MIKINAEKSGTPILGLNYIYDKANNIVQRNDNTYVYDKVNRLARATIRGVFEDEFTKADMLMGTADEDYFGEKNPEQDVTDQTEIKLDHSARSLILNLETDAENISRVELVPEMAGHRVPVEQLEIYYKRTENEFAYSKLERNAWSGTKDDKGRIIIKFTPVLNAHLLKIHCNYDDLNRLQEPIDTFSEFYNASEKLVTVYQKLVTRTESYQYDAMGNRIVERLLLRKESSYNYQYYPNSNRLMTNGRYFYEYDANGNLIKKGNKYINNGDSSQFMTSGEGVEYWEYSYDLFNQLEQVKKNGVVVSSYVYDPNGFRVRKVGSKGTVYYVPLLNGEVGYKKEINNSKEYSFIYVGGQHLARVNGVIGIEGKKFFYQNDHLGSALAVTDENGNKVVERDFAPFGEKIKLGETDGENSDEDESAFTGKDWDEDVGLYYFNARWMDPELGRFITEDSINDPNNPNLYVYCANNTLTNTDPTGHFKIDLAGGFMSLLSSIPGVGDILSGLNLFNKFVGDNKGESKGPKPKPTSTNQNTTVTSTNNEVQVKDKAGNVTASYNKEEMKKDFQDLAQKQQTGASDTKDFENKIKEKYKDFFDASKGSEGVSVIGLRGWGVGTPCQDTDKIKGEKNTYDDMLLTIDDNGNLDAFSRCNFEGTTATGSYNGGTLNNKGYPAIADGKYDLNSSSHFGNYNDVILTSNGSYDILIIGINPQKQGNTASGIEIHKGGNDWTWSKGCITIYAPPGDTSRWDRFIANFPTKAVGTKVGALNLMTL